MIFIRTHQFILFLLLGMLSILLVGAVSYLYLTAVQDKVLAEKMLFFTILAIVFFMLAAIRSFKVSSGYMKSLEKTLELARTNGILPEDRLERFGKLGKNLRILYRELADLNEKKADRISSLNALLANLIEFIDAPIGILDPKGRIVLVSERMLTLHQEFEGSIAGEQINELYPDFDFRSSLLEIQRSHTSVEIDLGKEKGTLYPIHGRKNEIAFLILSIGKKFSFTLQNQRLNDVQNPDMKKTSITKIFKTLLERFTDRG